MQQTNNSKRFLKNAVTVSIIQWTIQLLPFITIPILIRRLGVSGYGELSICLAFCAYTCLIVDFGFGWASTREVTLTSNDQDRAQLFWNVFYTKLYLLLVSLLVPLAAYTFINSQQLKTLIMSSCFISAVSCLVNPSWYLLGTEKAIQLNISSFIWRIIQIFLIILFVQSEQDVGVAVLLESLMGIFIALCNYRIFFSLPLNKPVPKDIKRTVKQSSSFFLSNIACSFYSTMNPLVLAFFCNKEVVGAYSIAEKLINALKKSTHPIFQIAYPRWIQLNKNINTQYYKESAIFLSVLTAWGVLTFIILLKFGGKLLLLVSDTQIPHSDRIIQILAATPLLAVISHFMGYQVLTPNNKEKTQTLILTLCGAFGLIGSIILTYFFAAEGLALSILIIEISIMLFMCKHAIQTLKSRGLNS